MISVALSDYNGFHEIYFSNNEPVLMLQMGIKRRLKDCSIYD